MHESSEPGEAGVQREMPRYISHKRVWALEISGVTYEAEVRSYRLSFKESGYADVIPDAAMFSRYVPVPGDFYVQYEDGYKSFSPRKAFIEGYKPDEGKPESA